MEHLVEFEDKEFATSSAKQDVIVDKKEFLNFMKIKPIWKFISVSRDSYLKLTTNEKLTLVNQYHLFVKSN